jgi:hypothetical protein
MRMGLSAAYPPKPAHDAENWRNKEWRIRRNASTALSTSRTRLNPPYTAPPSPKRTAGARHRSAANRECSRHWGLLNHAADAFFSTASRQALGIAIIFTDTLKTSDIPHTSPTSHYNAGSCALRCTAARMRAETKFRFAGCFHKLLVESPKCVLKSLG